MYIHTYIYIYMSMYIYIYILLDEHRPSLLLGQLELHVCLHA